MFNIGPLEFVVLACVALLVFGPEKLPQLTKDAVRMLRTVRDMAQGARSQLTSELGPEFANFDLNSLNPKTAIRNAIMGDDDDLSSLNPSLLLQKALRGEDEAAEAVAEVPTYSTSLEDEPAVSLSKDAASDSPTPGADAAVPGGADAAVSAGADGAVPGGAAGSLPADPTAASVELTLDTARPAPVSYDDIT